ncbi:hypothetical protein N4P33_21720 [Streptomyces sp. 15-116A]|uniref:hypothetical protein n=1 Tax=Streptomyces sp. 15-116A TaxID=2259035 RepID=UPI0021B1A53D|nr:hypothetical protein [Streptomyces sp. 15-116A]MCT7354752.1 hypothetical protein [Streptomyces sp. 15-116A]
MTKGRPLIDSTSLFSAVEGQPRRSTAVSPPPATNPFQAPDLPEDETLWSEEDVREPAPGPRAARRRAA